MNTNVRMPSRIYDVDYDINENLPYVSLGKTRYTNPLKQKLRAKRMAAESGFFCTTHKYEALTVFLSLDFSGWRCCQHPEAAQRPNARRVSPTKQDSLPAKPTRKRHEGSVGSPFRTVSRDLFSFYVTADL